MRRSYGAPVFLVGATRVAICVLVFSLHSDCGGHTVCVETRRRMKMKTRFRSLLAAAALLVAGGLSVSGASAGERVRVEEIRQLRESGQILSAEDILARSRAIQPGQVVGLELEREDGRWIYEVKLIDERNRVHELELDAANGEVLERKEK